jgi:hypothetical protein
VRLPYHACSSFGVLKRAVVFLWYMARAKYPCAHGGEVHMMHIYNLNHRSLIQQLISPPLQFLKLTLPPPSHCLVSFQKKKLWRPSLKSRGLRQRGSEPRRRSPVQKRKRDISPSSQCRSWLPPLCLPQPSGREPADQTRWSALVRLGRAKSHKRKNVKNETKKPHNPKKANNETMEQV